MKLLALDTSTEVCSVTLYLDGERISRMELAPQAHAALVLPMAESVLAEAGIVVSALDALAYGRGPGSFTGVRIGASVAQGIAFGADLAIAPVSSLAALAQGGASEAAGAGLLAAIDARMGEIYWCAYHVDATGLVRAAGAEQVLAPERVSPVDGGRWLGVGSGWDVYHGVLAARLGDVLEGWRRQRYPLAADVAMLGADAVARGAVVAPELALPVYVRDQVAARATP
jgi:tRNA threonylcarbamoyladenosine biosynthesis protein TsaB